MLPWLSNKVHISFSSPFSRKLNEWGSGGYTDMHFNVAQHIQTMLSVHHENGLWYITGYGTLLLYGKGVEGWGNAPPS